MGNKEHVEFLSGILGEPDGRKRWIEYKLKHPSPDLSGADFSNKDLRDFDFSEADFSKANFFSADLTGADFSDAQLGGADFRRATLANCCLDRADLSLASLQGALLTDACMEDADFSEAKLQGADLVGADLASANLTSCDLRAACLKYTRLSGAKLQGANVAEADLTGSVMDDDAPVILRNFDLAIVDDRKYRMMKSRVKAMVAPQEGRFEDTARTRTADSTTSSRDATQDRAETTQTQTETKGATGSRPPFTSPPTEDSKPQIKPESEPKVDKGDSSFIRKRDATGTGAGAAKGNTFGVSYVAVEADLKSDEGCCRVLGVRASATYDMITKAYRTKAKVFHPDKVRHLSDAEQKFAREQFELARRAYETLTRRKEGSMDNIKWVEGVPRRASPYEHTIDELVVLVAANPSNETLLYNLAYKYAEIGKWDDSIRLYERVLGVNPNNEDAQHNLRVVKLQKAFKLSPTR